MFKKLLRVAVHASLPTQSCLGGQAMAVLYKYAVIKVHSKQKKTNPKTNKKNQTKLQNVPDYISSAENNPFAVTQPVILQSDAPD